MKNYTLTSSITALPGVGPRGVRLFAKLGIATVRDLLLHVPSTYIDYSRLVPVASASVDTPVALYGKLMSMKSRRSFRNRKLTVTTAMFHDATGSIEVTWFNRFAFTLPQGNCYLTGEVRLVNGKKQISNPTIEPGNSEPVMAKHIVPVYPLTTGLTQWYVRRAVAAALPLIASVVDFLPERERITADVMPWPQAIAALHTPHNLVVVEAAKRRLAFDELLTVRLAQALVAREVQKQIAQKISVSAAEQASLLRCLPFQCTSEQREVLQAVLADIAKPTPARRLIQGEVGTGKTAIAGVALAATVSKGFQALYIAPTDVLARQHYETLNSWFQNFGIKVALLTSRTGMYAGEPSTPKAVRDLAAKGESAIFVGTHATVTHKTTFLKLGLVVIDEQHRFGVQLRHKAFQQAAALHVPHTISMTATPIPRTLQRALLEGFAFSTLHTPPLGKRRVHTAIIRPNERATAEDRLRKRLSAGEQAFVVCPIIDPSDILGVQSVQEVYNHLQRVFSGVAIAMLHGKLSPSTKTATLAHFKQGKINVLVATSLIEVGIDVPAATIMVIEGAERFGLAQLHQLRGRVGRAGTEGFCLLFISDSVSSRALERLRLFAKTEDAFRLAELDLSLRGPGEWFGVRQSGFPELRFADLSDDTTVALASSVAETLLRIDETGASYKSYFDAAQVLCAAADIGL